MVHNHLLFGRIRLSTPCFISDAASGKHRDVVRNRTSPVKERFLKHHAEGGYRLLRKDNLKIIENIKQTTTCGKKMNITFQGTITETSLGLESEMGS